MKIIMKTQISGTRDGVEWPHPGGVIDVPSAEAEALLHAGYAQRPGSAEGDVEQATAPTADVEQATAPRRRRKATA